MLYDSSASLPSSSDADAIVIIKYVMLLVLPTQSAFCVTRRQRTCLFRGFARRVHEAIVTAVFA